MLAHVAPRAPGPPPGLPAGVPRVARRRAGPRPASHFARRPARSRPGRVRSHGGRRDHAPRGGRSRTVRPVGDLRPRPPRRRDRRVSTSATPSCFPTGPARDRAAATARSVAVMLGPFDPDRYATACAPAIELRRPPGAGRSGPLSGARRPLQWLRSLLEVAENVANRFEDVLGLRSDALLLRWTNFGTERAGGGSYERQFLWLGVFGTDGLLTRLELFEGDRDAEALARFDELAAAAAPARSTRRRVRRERRDRERRSPRRRDRCTRRRRARRAVRRRDARS